MHTIILTFLSDLLAAAAIWIVLIVLAILALFGLLGRPSRGERISPEQRARGARLKQARLAARADRLERRAREIEASARRAADLAERRRQEWLAAQSQAEIAWQSYDAADSAAQRVILAAKHPTPATPSTPAEYAFRERYLHRHAMMACSHRQLSALDLSDALAHRNGWNPKLHPYEQEVVLCRAVRDTMLMSYQAAAERERESWHFAELAVAAASSLRREAVQAVEQAELARRSVRPTTTTARAAMRSRLHWGMRVTARASR